MLQPYRELNWWRWMYRASPYTYLIEAILGQGTSNSHLILRIVSKLWSLAIGHKEIQCSAIEYVTVEPPSGQTCQQYLGPFIDMAGGYVENPSASSGCQYCAFQTTDQFLLSSFNIEYSHHWRNFGLFFVFIGFNVRCFSSRISKA